MEEWNVSGRKEEWWKHLAMFQSRNTGLPKHRLEHKQTNKQNINK